MGLGFFLQRVPPWAESPPPLLELPLAQVGINTQYNYKYFEILYNALIAKESKNI